MKFQPHERIFCEIFAPGNIGEMGLHYTKLEEMSRVSLRNTLRGNPKTKLQSHPNSVFFPSNNEKQTTKAQRDFLKRKRPQPEHQAPKRYVEVGIKNLHRIQAD
ncbi:MAG: hypothetical protein SOZ09_10885 [Eubacteriales bacterium]|nr:hypothetical protein [Eubacteriales bacterium]